MLQLAVCFSRKDKNQALEQPTAKEIWETFSSNACLNYHIVMLIMYARTVL